MDIEDLPILKEMPRFGAMINVFERAEIKYIYGSFLNPNCIVADVCGVYDDRYLFYYPVSKDGLTCRDDIINIDICTIVEYTPIKKIK